jgi:hypothetical protein
MNSRTFSLIAGSLSLIVLAFALLEIKDARINSADPGIEIIPSVI